MRNEVIMKDIKFVLGECTKSNTKYYFQYNNKVYFIIEKSPTSETILEKITNIRFAYEKWRTIKADSDDKGKKVERDNPEEEIVPKDYSYTTMVFDYESDPIQNNFRERLPKEKIKIEKVAFDKGDERFEKKKKPKKNEYEKRNRDKYSGEYPVNERKEYKKNSRFEKSNQFRRNEYRGEKQKNNH